VNRRFLHNVFNVVVGVGALFNVLFAICLKTEVDSVWPVIRPLLTSIQQRIWWLWPIVTLVMFSARMADKRFCDKWGFEAVKEMLEILREKAFPENSDPQHHHRVTLFRYRKWRICLRKWPWSGWLVPVVRSGHTTQHRKTCFLAPDDADKAEGIVGRTWSTCGVIVVPDFAKNQAVLPNLLFEEERPHDIHPIADVYSKATYVSIDWVLKNLPGARSFMGIPVTVKGVPWGVIVVDSRNPHIENSSRVYEAYNLISRPLIKCIERLQ